MSFTELLSDRRARLAWSSLVLAIGAQLAVPPAHAGSAARHAQEEGGEADSESQEAIPEDSPPALQEEAPEEQLEEHPEQQPEPEDQAIVAPDEGSAAGDALLATPSYPIHGSVTARYRLRATPGASDNDFFSTLYMDFGDPARHPWTGRLSVNGNFALDGVQLPGSTFFSVWDTYGSPAVGRLYEAFVDANHIDGLQVLRFGRQQMIDTPVFLWFDGVLVETREATDERLRFGAYGGLPVHYFQRDSSGNALYGAFAEGRPWEGGRLRFDWTHLEDRALLGDHQNDIFNLGYWQSLARGLNLEGQYSRLDSKNRDVRVTARGYSDEHDFTLQASYYELLEPQGHLALELDPFFGSLLALFPYYQAQVLASKTIDERVILQGGLDLRRVRDQADVGIFNRDFDRYYLSSTFADLLHHQLDFTLTGEVWDSEQREIQTWGADLRKEFTERSEGSLGTYYSLYKYDYFTGSERDQIRSYYLRLRHQQTKNLSFSLGYEFENNPFDDFHTLRLSLIWHF